MDNKNPKDRRFNMRISEDETLMLRVLADKDGRSPSDYLRRAIFDNFEQFAKEHGRSKEEALEIVRDRTPWTSQFELEVTTKELHEMHAIRPARHR